MIYPQKEQVKKRFERNFNTYNNEATVQLQIAKKLSELLKTSAVFKTDKILEIGAGTGFLTENLLQRFNIGHYILNDLAENSAAEVVKRTSNNKLKESSFLFGDAEKLNFPDQLDAIVSSSCFQWFNDLNSFFAKTNYLLNAKGVLAFSSFGENNFIEIRKTLNVGLAYAPLDSLKQMLSQNFELLHVEEWKEQLWFESPKAILKHIKKTGVNGVCSKGFWGKDKLRQFSEQYNKLFSNNSGEVSLTYHPIIIIAQRKPVQRESKLLKETQTTLAF